MWVLFLTLLLIIFIVLIITKNDILSPSLASMGVFTLGAFAAAINNCWGYRVTGRVNIIVIVGLLTFLTGEIVARRCFENNNKEIIYTKNKEIVINKGVLIFFIIIICITIFLQYKNMNLIALDSGYSSNLDKNMLTFARYGVIHGNNNSGLGLTLLYYFSVSISYTSAFILVHNTVFYKYKKIYFLYLVLILECFILFIFNTNRILYLYFFVFCVVCYSIFYYKKNGWKERNTIKILKKYAISFLLFFIFFNILAQILDKGGNGLFDSFNSYLGGPLVGFDIFLNGDYASNHFWGQESLSGFYSLLNTLKIWNYSGSRNLSFIYYDNFSINVFTSLRRYLSDFGIIGVIFIQFLLGFLITTLYLRVKNSKNIKFIYLIYFYIFSYVIVQVFDDNFLTTFLSIDQIMTFLFLGVMYKIFIYPQLNVTGKVYEFN